MSAEDVRTLEEAADVLMRLHATATAIKLYALALKIRADLCNCPPGMRYHALNCPNHAGELRTVGCG